jgi:predicted RNase H-like HicB family nuclease
MAETQRIAEIEKILRKPYTLTFQRDEDGYYIAQVVEFPGCVIHGETLVEAAQRMTEVLPLWLDACLDGGMSVPEPLEGLDVYRLGQQLAALKSETR